MFDLYVLHGTFFKFLTEFSKLVYKLIFVSISDLETRRQAMHFPSSFQSYILNHYT